jgi:ribonuclease HI
MNIFIFTDGCFKLKDNEILAGCGVHFPNKELEDLSEPFTLTPLTNQRAELYAIFRALEYIYENDLQYDTLTIYSDSEYSIKSLTIWITKWIDNNWVNSRKQPVKNQDLIKMIYYGYLQNNEKISFQHVKSHTKNKDFNSIHNDIVDKLANKGSTLFKTKL